MPIWCSWPKLLKCSADSQLSFFHGAMQSAVGLPGCSSWINNSKTSSSSDAIAAAAGVAATAAGTCINLTFLVHRGDDIWHDDQPGTMFRFGNRTTKGASDQNNRILYKTWWIHLCSAKVSGFFVAHVFEMNLSTFHGSLDHHQVWKKDQLPGRSCEKIQQNPKLTCRNIRSKSAPNNFICISVVNLLGVVRFCCVLIFNIMIISLPYSAPPSAFPVVPVVVVVVAKVEVVSVGHWGHLGIFACATWASMIEVLGWHFKIEGASIRTHVHCSSLLRTAMGWVFFKMPIYIYIYISYFH